MKTKIVGIIIIVLIIVIGAGAWIGLSGKKGAEEATTLPGEEAVTPGEEAVTPSKETNSLTEILSKAKGVTSFKYDTIVTLPGQTAVTQKVWFKGNKMKTEMTTGGQKAIYLMDSDEKIAYMYMPAQNTATKMNLSEAQETAEESPIEKSDFIMEYKPVIVGSETLDGKDCLVIEYTVEGAKVKMWMWKEHGFPIKTESTTAAGTSVIELKNIEFVDIPDSTFELPEGVQIIEIPSS